MRANHTGYTHQWRTRHQFSDLLMASINPNERPEPAWDRGWRTFRIGNAPIRGRETMCPAYTHKGTTCADCMLCHGAGTEKSIVIPDHGHGRCYVHIWQAPRSIWDAYQNGSYTRDVRPEYFANRLVRVGSYGDGTAVPKNRLRQVLPKDLGTTARPKEPGVIVYEGPSMLDKKPIVMIATGWNGTRNGKTGQMLQTWILRKNISPMDASRRKLDASVCGKCPLRHSLNRKAKP